MKTYIVTLDKKNPGMDTNTMESVHIQAKNWRVALSNARRMARREGMVVVSVRTIR